MAVDTSRFEDPGSFYSALLEAFSQEKERSMRSGILRRLADGLDQDERLAPLFVGLLSDHSLSDDESAVVALAVATLPTISEGSAVMALRQALHAPAAAQEVALSIAEKCPHWGEAMVAEMEPYLDLAVQSRLRLRVLKRLAEAKVLTEGYLPALVGILRNDTDPNARKAALELLSYLRTWDENASLALLWTSQNDADASLRTRAVQLQAEAPDLTDEQVASLAGRLASDDLSRVRTEVLQLLQGRLGQVELRAAVVASFAQNPAAFATEELSLLVQLLGPYARRDPVVRDTLVRSVPRVRRVDDRLSLLDAVLSSVRPDDVAGLLVEVFRQERQPEIRQVLFDRLRPLSVVKNPALVSVFCDELADPGSAFRSASAHALAGAVEAHAEVVDAFEDVLRYDDERELVQTCLDAYLKPSVERKFQVLLAVMGTETIDLASRQRCLDSIDRAALPAEQAQQLADLVSSPSGSGLRARP
jgi:hypothetical protein